MFFCSTKKAIYRYKVNFKNLVQQTSKFSITAGLYDHCGSIYLIQLFPNTNEKFILIIRSLNRSAYQLVKTRTQLLWMGKIYMNYKCWKTVQAGLSYLNTKHHNADTPIWCRYYFELKNWIFSCWKSHANSNQSNKAFCKVFLH